MLRSVAEGVRRQSVTPNVLAYHPHPKQVKFHNSQARIRLYIGGNRSGKTVSGTVEDIYYLRGQHPYRKVPEPPVRGRVVCVDWTYGIGQIVIPKFKQWIPPSLLIDGSWDRSYSATDKVLTCSNGSTVEFMTYEQEQDKFAGTSRHFIHFDEEPPFPIYDECRARTIDVKGDMWVTMTPVNGMTWIYDKIYQPGLLQTPGSNIDVIIVDMTENPYLPPDAALEYLASLDDDTRRARAHGEFVQIGGLVYKKFSKSEHVIPVADPRTFPRGTEFYMSMDHGYNNPTAWLWHAVFPDSTIVTFDEHYASEMIVEEHVEVVKSKGNYFHDATILGDPSIAQRSGINGTSIQTEYAERGIYIGLANNDVVTGVNKVNSYLKTNPKTGKPFWQITENCEKLISEMLRLRWKTYSSPNARHDNNKREEIHKKDDHACDSARYFFSAMPDLTPELLTDPKKMPINTNTETYDKVLARMARDGDLRTIWTPDQMHPSALEWE